MTDDLVQFLRDRLDEDEQAAQAATWHEDAGTWTAGLSEYEPRWYIEDSMDDGVISRVDPQASQDEGVARHIARHDPARVLREVEAKRRLLDTYLADAAGADEQINDEWRAGSTLAADLLCIMALAYSGHPGYRREDWRP
jgi:hypothetical protein